MRINEVYAILYESYRVMQSTWLEFMEWAKENEPNLADSLSENESEVIDLLKYQLNINVSTLAEAYEVFMKRNIKLAPLDAPALAEHGDSSYWIRLMKQFMAGPDSPQISSLSPEGIEIELEEFGERMVETTDQLVRRAEDKKFKKDYKVIEKTPTWIMYQPKHRAAACHLGTGTKWCISARGDDNYYDHYAEKTDIYIIHTATKKFAILIAAHSGEIFEVQTEKNDFQKPTDEILQQFADQMKSAGVDVARVEELLDVEFDPKWELELVGIDSPDELTSVRQVADTSSVYEKVVIPSPNYIFTDAKGVKKTLRSGDSILLAYKKDGGLDVAYVGLWSDNLHTAGETLATTILEVSSVFKYARQLSDDEKSKLLKKIESLITNEYQLPPNYQLISLAELTANAKK